MKKKNRVTEKPMYGFLCVLQSYATGFILSSQTLCNRI